MNNKNKNISFNHSEPIQIRFSDIDPLNHVNNSIISQYYDVGRINYLKAVIGEGLMWNSIGVVIVNLNTNFFAPIFINDDIIVQTRLVGFGNKSMKTFQQIVDRNTNIIKSTCETILSGFDSETNKSSEVPQEFKKMFMEFENLIL